MWAKNDDFRQPQEMGVWQDPDNTDNWLRL